MKNESKPIRAIHTAFLDALVGDEFFMAKEWWFFKRLHHGGEIKRKSMSMSKTTFERLRGGVGGWLGG